MRVEASGRNSIYRLVQILEAGSVALDVAAHGASRRESGSGTCAINAAVRAVSQSKPLNRLAGLYFCLNSELKS